MIIFLLLFILYIVCSSKNLIRNGIYNILINKQYLFYNYNNLSISKDFKYPNTFFRIRMVYKKGNTTFYNIEKLHKVFKLTYKKNKQLYFNKTNNNLSQWTFIETENNEYIIKNKNNCYIKVYSFQFLCIIIPTQKATKFFFLRIFSEIKEHIAYNDLKLLDKEPIDVLIKYIDLRDPNLKRKGIHQIEKDYDNEELRYSIRSVLMNIPWIRKIFILMPNKKVRFFKRYKYIKNKIVYVKDRDLLGYDSSNSNSFQFKVWKMKKFGISDNIIIMDDDCFIGKKLEKSDFFYAQNGNIFPLIITSKFLKIDKNKITESFEYYKIKAKNSKEEQNSDIFSYSKFLTILFILNLFNFTSKENVYIPKFTHNAIPINLNDIKEIYNLVYYSKYKYATLYCNYRITGFFQFQIFVLAYTFIKYDRKVKNIRSKYFEIDNQNINNYKFPLFCINKGSGNYSFLHYFKCKMAMEYIFHKPTPYEINDFSSLNLSINLLLNYDHQINNNENIFHQSPSQKNFYYFIIIFILIVFFSINKKIHKN